MSGLNRHQFFALLMLPTLSDLSWLWFCLRNTLIWEKKQKNPISIISTYLPVQFVWVGILGSFHGSRNCLRVKATKYSCDKDVKVGICNSKAEMSSRMFPGSGALPAEVCRQAEAAGFRPGLRRPHQSASGAQRSAERDTELEESLCSPDQLGEHLHMWSRK